LINSFVFAATYRESGASLRTIDTVEEENPDSRATSASVILPEFRVLRIN
jgi:hypothetical protein